MRCRSVLRYTGSKGLLTNRHHRVCMQGIDRMSLHKVILLSLIYLSPSFSLSQLPLRCRPSKPPMSPGTVCRWRGNSRIDPTGSSWSMRSSSMKRWGARRLMQLRLLSGMSICRHAVCISLIAEMDLQSGTEKSPLLLSRLIRIRERGLTA